MVVGKTSSLWQLVLAPQFEQGYLVLTTEISNRRKVTIQEGMKQQRSREIWWQTWIQRKACDSLQGRPVWGARPTHWEVQEETQSALNVVAASCASQGKLSKILSGYIDALKSEIVTIKDEVTKLASELGENKGVVGTLVRWQYARESCRLGRDYGWLDPS